MSRFTERKLDIMAQAARIRVMLMLGDFYTTFADRGAPGRMETMMGAPPPAQAQPPMTGPTDNADSEMGQGPMTPPEVPNG